MSIITFLRPKQRANSALVHTSSCRGYVVELDPEEQNSPRMLENLTGKVVHFRSLDRVRDALRRRGVRKATLVQSHACEELSALGVSKAEERGVTVLDETGS